MEVSLSMYSDDIQVPSYAHEGDAGLDLRAVEGGTIKPFERKMVPCGFAIAIPEGYAGLIMPRSGLASQWGITVANAPGLIDSGYRGELKVCLINLDPSTTFSYERGDRIAQLVVVATPSITLHNTSHLPDSQRGFGGFGSSGIS